MTLVYANIASLNAISWQLLKKGFTVLKNIFPHIKWFENSLEKKFPDLKIFPPILAENTLFFPDFPDWKKSSKFSLNFLIGGNLDHTFPQLQYETITSVSTFLGTDKIDRIHTWLMCWLLQRQCRTFFWLRVWSGVCLPSCRRWTLTYCYPRSSSWLTQLSKGISWF